MKEHGIFRAVWRSVNVLLAVSVFVLLFAAGWEYSVRRYLKGFSAAIVPTTASPDQKVEAILDWMRNGPGRISAPSPEGLAARDPENTLNYQQLLQVCGTATNAFLNLAKGAGLPARRLLLLSSDHRANHVVAEVLIDGRWIVVDPVYRTIPRDARGRPLTRQELSSPEVFSAATRTIPGYPPEYDYDEVTHLRMGRIPLVGAALGRMLDRIYPGWDEAADWSLIVERRSFAVLFASILATVALLALRTALAWYGDRRLHVQRLRLRAWLARVGVALFSSPNMPEAGQPAGRQE
jgi:hypothetical protein